MKMIRIDSKGYFAYICAKQIDMKRLILIIIAALGFAIGSKAQSYNIDDRLYVVNETFYMNGVPLTEGELFHLLGDEVYNNEYLPASKKLKTSNILGYIGGTLVGTGVGCALGHAISTLAYGGEFYARPYAVYGCITLVGLIPSILHFNMSKKGVSTYASIAESYNKSTGKVMELTLSPASSGFGIALNF